MALQTGLMSLPAELRKEIYVHVFDWNTRLVEARYLTQAAKKGLDCGVCLINFRKNRNKYTANDDGCPVILSRYGAEDTDRHSAILQTCRKIYFEAIDTLYSKTLFVFTDGFVRPAPFMFRYYRRSSLPSMGTTADCCDLLQRMRHVVVEQHINTGRQGLAVGPNARLLKDIVNAMSSARKSTEVSIRFDVGIFHLTATPRAAGCYEELAIALAGMEPGCRPGIAVENWRYGNCRPIYAKEKSDHERQFMLAFEAAGVPCVIVPSPPVGDMGDC
ncbi:hypothetical protein Slin15195_G064430 [Septoria linicola]|uniref:DUF7730 domain-containing protein n=1 Tax=Septoria linicola TaxID=215465 RepID=A0A9Q9ARB3_9PEZI|nr:hypothetical protein Slin15195_G064430 [Septoria linicola]